MMTRKMIEKDGLNQNFMLDQVVLNLNISTDIIKGG